MTHLDFNDPNLYVRLVDTRSGRAKALVDMPTYIALPAKLVYNTRAELVRIERAESPADALDATPVTVGTPKPLKAATVRLVPVAGADAVLLDMLGALEL